METQQLILNRIISSQTNIIKIKVTPNKHKTQIIGLMSDANTIKIDLKAKPINNQANQALIAFLGKQLNLPSTALKIIKGQTSANKLISINHDLSK